MKRIRTIIDKAWMWVAHHFGVKNQMIPSLHYIDIKDVKCGMLYEWYGRIVKAHKNPQKPIVRYYIYPSKEISQKSVDLICENSDNLIIKERCYETTDKKLGDALKRDTAITVVEDIENKPCDNCCMMQEGYPCPGCTFNIYWEKVAQYKQNCTNQDAWMRAMERMINRNR